MGFIKALVLVVFGAAGLYAVAVALVALGPWALGLYVVALALWIGLFAVLYPPKARLDRVPGAPAPAEPERLTDRGSPFVPPAQAEIIIRARQAEQDRRDGIVRAPRLRQDGYTADWPAVSWAVRREARWRCQACGVNLRGARHLLHTHHKNRNKQDNRPVNLIALCVICHCAQPKHGRLAEKARSRGTYAAAEVIRKQQNIGV